MTTPATPLRLYELVLENGRSASPYVWRIRYALAHKGLAYQTLPLGFTDIPTVLDGRFKTVPILEHGATSLAESWDIALYIDRAFPDTPALFSGSAEVAAIRLFDSWFSIEVMRRMATVYILDVHNAARPADQAYFRTSREARFKVPSLESFAAGRESRLPGLREALAALRLHLARFAFLGGDRPSYADFIALGAFQWAGSVGTLPPLAKDDAVLRDWLERGFDLYGGVGRLPGLRPLFEA